MTPTSQAQRAIDSLRKAGYARSEFTVKTEVRRYTDSNGNRVTEYGDATILVWAPLERQLELAQAVADSGIAVDIPNMHGKDTYPIYWNDDDSGIRRYNVNAQD